MHEAPYNPLECPTCAEWDVLAGIERATEEAEREEAGLNPGGTTICALTTGFIWLSAFGLELGGNRLTALFFFGLGLMFFGGTLALWAKSEEEV